MTSRLEDLRMTYRSEITPSRFGTHFRERPQPDALGRTPATPLEIQRAIKGEFNLPPQQLAANPSGRRERVVTEWEFLKLAREQRQTEARKARSCGNYKDHYERR